MQQKIYVDPNHQKIFDGVCDFFYKKHHSVYQIGYGVLVSLEPTHEDEMGPDKEGVHLYTQFFLCDNSDNEKTAGLGLVSEHTEPNIAKMTQEYLNNL